MLFVPYALHDRDGYARTAREKFESLGKAGPPRAAAAGARAGTGGALVPGQRAVSGSAPARAAGVRAGERRGAGLAPVPAGQLRAALGAEGGVR